MNERHALGFRLIQPAILFCVRLKAPKVEKRREAHFPPLIAMPPQQWAPANQPGRPNIRTPRQAALNTMTKILVVDDQPTLIELLSEFLGDEGYDVTGHTDGLTALQQMLAVRPDVVITDFSMPGMHGGALLTAMRENAYLCDTPVVVLSGRPEYEVDQACEGYAVYLRKPAEPTEVLAAVRRLAPAPAAPTVAAAPARPARLRSDADDLAAPLRQNTAGASHGSAAYFA